MLELRIRNLGRIAEAVLDIRPLTLLIGHNNTNKSWTAYAMWQALRFQSLFDVPSESFSMPDRSKKPLDELLEIYARSEIGQRLNLSLQPAPWAPPVKVYTVSVARLADTLRVPRALVERATVEVHHAPGQLVQGMTTSLTKSRGSALLEVSYALASGREATDTHLVQDAELEQTLMRTLLQLNARYHHTATFPVDRVAVEAQFESQHPIFANMFRALFRARAGERRGYLDIERILGGSLVADPNSWEFQPTGGPALPIGASASLVRSIAPFLLYVDTVGEPGDLLVIDEPEMNAHPRAQLAIAELLALLANRGFHLIVTTHSPYIADHLCNLMEAHSLPESSQRDRTSSFALQTTEAFLDAEKLAVYEFVAQGETVQIRDALDREDRVIDTSTFAKITDQTSDILGMLLSAK